MIFFVCVWNISSVFCQCFRRIFFLAPFFHCCCCNQRVSVLTICFLFYLLLIWRVFFARSFISSGKQLNVYETRSANLYQKHIACVRTGYLNLWLVHIFSQCGCLFSEINWQNLFRNLFHSWFYICVHATQLACSQARICFVCVIDIRHNKYLELGFFLFLPLSENSKWRKRAFLAKSEKGKHIFLLNHRVL